MNAKEYGYPLSKKGLLRGYIKYGVFAYMTWHFFKLAITPAEHHGGHTSQGHDAHGHDGGHGAAAVAHGHGEHGH